MIERTFIVADWLEDDRPGAPPRQLPAFEGILTGRWNGFAEWKTNRRVIEQFIRLQDAIKDLDLDDWRFDGDTLVVTAPDYPDEPTFVEPDEDGLYDLGLGYVWVTYDQYDVDADLSTYTLYLMGEPTHG